MKNKICIIVPTRKRFLDFNFLASTWKRTTEGKSVVAVGVDEDDNTYDRLIEKNPYSFIWERTKPSPFLPTLNKLAIKYAKEYKYIGYISDDLAFNTSGWETLIINKLNELGKNGIIWVNDGHCPVNLANKIYPHNCGIPFMNSSIINRLGYMCPLKLHSAMADGYWGNLVMKMPNSSYFFKDIIIEHRHFSFNLRNKDETSYKIEGEASPDYKFFNSDQFYIDVEKDVKMLLST